MKFESANTNADSLSTKTEMEKVFTDTRILTIL